MLVFVIKLKLQFSLHNWENFSPSIIPILRVKGNLAEVSRKTLENTKNSQLQNTLDPETAQGYISQFSEEIEGRVIEKFSKDFSRTESCILGALSKLDEFLLNPEVRTCSVAGPGHPGTTTQKTGNPLGIVAHAIPVPKWCSLPITLVI